ncbi:protein NRT1/ PTR FAMILY 5.5-like [Salvia splendens]|uniref:protein NRT1/ PTR FAMILY 5.5-like n=1 Tax=Salvia splendens TaxID=180675 RepID=UPI001C26D6F6|nr:protein NRT1/ PTR FAMILY 5.5-like [Salvia splendens]
MQDYLTEVWGLSLTRAAATVSIWIGLSLVLQPLFHFFACSFLGHLKMLVISSSAYTLGIISLYLSTPPVLANPCKNYEPECVGKTQKALLYTGMVLMAVGAAGQRVSLAPLLEAQYISPLPDQDQIYYLPKIFTVRMTLMWTTFITYGMVSSLGRTYFVDQAKHLDQPKHLGKWKAPTQVLLLAQIWLAKLLYYVIRKLFRASTEIFMAKLFGVLCCITAAIMERKRLGIVRSHGLVDKPDQDIPMSVYWLFFQFIFLGCMDRLFEASVDGFIENKPRKERGIPDALTKCLEIYSQGAYGLGYMCSVLLVFVVGKISEKGDKPSWFQSTSNRSHLDHYYWVLAVLSGTSLVMFSVWGMYQRCFRPRH